jgi:hypothetical protein
VWELVKHKLGKLGCFIFIALMMILATALTKAILGWRGYDKARQAAISDQVGDYVGKGLLGVVFIAGSVMMGLQLRAELRAKRRQPPPIPPVSQPRRAEPPVRPPRR